MRVRKGRVFSTTSDEAWEGAVRGAQGKMQIHGWTSAHLVARDNTPQPVIASDRPGSERAGHFDAELEVGHHEGRRAESRVEILRAVECCGWL